MLVNQGFGGIIENFRKKHWIGKDDFPFHSKLTSKNHHSKTAGNKGNPLLPAAVLFLLSIPAVLSLLDFILPGLAPALLRPYFGLPGPYSILTLSLFLDVIPDHTIQIKTQDTKH